MTRFSPTLTRRHGLALAGRSLGSAFLNSRGLGQGAGASTAVGHPPTQTSPPDKINRYFSDRSPWNLEAATAQLSPRSGQMVAAIQANISRALQLNWGPKWTPMVYWAKPGAPRIYALGTPGKWIPRNGSPPTDKGPGTWRMDGVPLVEGATASPDSDAHCLIIDEAGGKAYSFFQFEGIHTDADGNNYYLHSGGGWNDLKGSGYWDPSGGEPDVYGPWIGRSSNSSMLAGLILVDQLRQGEIPHQIAVSMDPKLMEATPVPPALTTDDWETQPDGTGVPNGTWLSLDPSLDVDKFASGREARIILRALQRYGARVCERGEGFAMYFENRSAHVANPYFRMDFSGLNARVHQYWRVMAPAAPADGYDHPGKVSPPNPYPVRY